MKKITVNCPWLTWAVYKHKQKVIVVTNRPCKKESVQKWIEKVSRPLGEVLPVVLSSEQPFDIRWLKHTTVRDVMVFWNCHKADDGFDLYKINFKAYSQKKFVKKYRKYIGTYGSFVDEAICSGDLVPGKEGKNGAN